MTWFRKPDSNDVDDDTRDYLAENCKEGVQPKDAIGDWGDKDKDHNDDQHHRAWGDAWKHRVDTSQPEDVNVKRRDK